MVCTMALTVACPRSVETMKSVLGPDPPSAIVPHTTLRRRVAVPGPRSVINTVLDPQRRRVELSSDRWQHIIERHPELMAHRHDILRAVRAPTLQRPISLAECWFFLEGVGPSKWLRVVVRYSTGEGRIITAFPQRAEP